MSFWWHDNFCLTKQWHDTRMLTEMIWTFYTCNNFAIRFITAILKCRSKVVTRFLFHITWKDRNNFFKYLDKRIKTFSFLNLYGCFLRILHDGQNFSRAYSSFILLYMSSNMFYLVSIIHISSQKERNALVCFHIIFNIVWHMIPTRIRKVSFQNDDISYMKFILLYAWHVRFIFQSMIKFYLDYKNMTLRNTWYLPLISCQTPSPISVYLT